LFSVTKLDRSPVPSESIQKILVGVPAYARTPRPVLPDGNRAQRCPKLYGATIASSTQSTEIPILGEKLRFPEDFETSGQ
jgi:hypothetical protein